METGLQNSTTMEKDRNMRGINDAHVKRRKMQ
jgi:hypothetical protein